MPQLRIRFRVNTREDNTPSKSSHMAALQSCLLSLDQQPDYTCAKPDAFVSQRTNSSLQQQENEIPLNYIWRALNVKIFAKTVVFMIGILTTTSMYSVWFQRTSATIKPILPTVPTTPESSASGRGATHVNREIIPKIKLRPHEIPIVYRSVLEKLEGNSVRRKKDIRVDQWPPLVTHIPEVDDAQPGRVQLHVCDDSKINSCRFLFPFRISDQEYRARGHIEQLAKLALELNRTLVLPNVGKGQLGPCYKHDFEVYYDPQSLEQSLGISVISMNAFKSWTGSRSSITAQVVTLSTQPWRNGTFPVVSNEEALVQVDNFRDAKDFRFPRCFGKKFPHLVLENSFPHVIISPTSLKAKSIGASVAYTLSGKSKKPQGATNASTEDLVNRISTTKPQLQPDVLLVNWGLLYPIFQQSSDPILQYSLDVSLLVEKITPPGPYLAIYWSLESLSSDLSEICAHALVDTISSLLFDPALSFDIKNVFFSSDYPDSLSQTTPYLRGSNSSHVRMGDPRNITDQQVEAVNILREAFKDNGVLSQWTLTDFIGEMSRDKEKNLSFQDKGVFEILARVISSRGALFVTANSRTCGGASSLAADIIDIRRVKSNGMQLKNLVDVFG